MKKILIIVVVLAVIGIILFVPIFNGYRCPSGVYIGETPSKKINLVTILYKKIYGCPIVA